jgi:hypothetical protein
MWIQSVFNAISEVESTKPGAVNRVAQFNPSCNDWTQSDWEDYNLVAAAIVEPFTFPGGESEDDEFYYERTDRDGYGMVKANISGIENYESWVKVCDLIEAVGY